MTEITPEAQTGKDSRTGFSVAMQKYLEFLGAQGDHIRSPVEKSEFFYDLIEVCSQVMQAAQELELAISLSDEAPYLYHSKIKALRAAVSDPKLPEEVREIFLQAYIERLTSYAEALDEPVLINHPDTE